MQSRDVGIPTARDVTLTRNRFSKAIGRGTSPRISLGPEDVRKNEEVAGFTGSGLLWVWRRRL